MQEYSTTDIYLAAALATVGFELLRLDSLGENKKSFTFVWDNVIETYASDYSLGRLTVYALSYASHIQEMKGLIHNSRK